MIINREKLEELSACDESLGWIGDAGYSFTADGVRAALGDRARPYWVLWLLEVTNCCDPEMWEAAGVRAITKDVTVTSGFAVCCDKSPAITVRGVGNVRVCGDAKPTITVRGGAVDIYGNAEPTITVSGGEVRVFGKARAKTTIGGGKVVVSGGAEVEIAMSGGVVRASKEVPSVVCRGDNGAEVVPMINVHGWRTYCCTEPGNET